MSIWKRISDALAALAQGEGLSAVFEKLRTPPERTIGFTIAVIALGAKMAKADGLVTRDEVTAFRQVFHIPTSETQNAARVFDLARARMLRDMISMPRVFAICLGQDIRHWSICWKVCFTSLSRMAGTIQTKTYF